MIMFIYPPEPLLFLMQHHPSIFSPNIIKFSNIICQAIHIMMLKDVAFRWFYGFWPLGIKNKGIIGAHRKIQTFHMRKQQKNRGNDESALALKPMHGTVGKSSPTKWTLVYDLIKKKLLK